MKTKDFVIITFICVYALFTHPIQTIQMFRRVIKEMQNG